MDGRSPRAGAEGGVKVDCFGRTLKPNAAAAATPACAVVSFALRACTGTGGGADRSVAVVSSLSAFSFSFSLSLSFSLVSFSLISFSVVSVSLLSFSLSWVASLASFSLASFFLLLLSFSSTISTTGGSRRLWRLVPVSALVSTFSIACGDTSHATTSSSSSSSRMSRAAAAARALGGAADLVGNKAFIAASGFATCAGASAGSIMVKLGLRERPPFLRLLLLRFLIFVTSSLSEEPFFFFFLSSMAIGLSFFGFFSFFLTLPFNPGWWLSIDSAVHTLTPTLTSY
mmetsp:Transcript_45509/g.99117  ORF Transcript_45509/g.99117 Transcript_45509/m.99117 type:complete len:286 (+) Transcript_45509:343-1200(+)